MLLAEFAWQSLNNLVVAASDKFHVDVLHDLQLNNQH